MNKKIIRAFSAQTRSAIDGQANEDSYLVYPERLLFGVADGFGGSTVGPAAVKKCLDDVKLFVENGLGDSEVTLPFVYRSYLSASANLIFNSFLYANQNLYSENKNKN